VIHQSLLFALCCFLGSQLLAGPIPTLTATSVSIFTSIGYVAEGETDSMGASGLSFTLAGSGFVPGSGRALFPIGVPVNIGGPVAFCCEIGFGRNLVTGAVTLGGSITQVNYVGGAIAFAPPYVVTLPSTGFSISLPATATGSFSANTCGAFEFPPNCSGPQIANIAINLPGYVGLSFAPFGGGIAEELLGATFTSSGPIPEPSSVSLLLVGLVVAIALALYRKRLQRLKN
jgi:hypothetical protein